MINAYKYNQININMKKRWFLFLIFLLSISYAYAGDVHYIDFKNNNVNILTSLKALVKSG